MTNLNSVAWTDDRIAAFMAEMQPPNPVDFTKCARAEALAHWNKFQCEVRPKKRKRTWKQTLKNLAAGFFSF